MPKVLILFIFWNIAACSSASQEVQPTETIESDDIVQATPDIPITGSDESAEVTPPEVKPFGDNLLEGWNVFQPGGDTTCSRGTPFTFAARKGNSRKLLVDFIGGGACWNEFTCGFADAIFSDNADWVKDFEGKTGVQGGIYDETNPDNPFADYHHVVIPYCTGDIHWGNASMVYGEGTDKEVAIEHKGAVNTQAVLDWIEANYHDPDQIFVTGCSAGSYGSIMWAAHLGQMFPDADLVQLGDSGLGIITESWFQDSFPQWNAEPSFPSFISSMNPEEINLLDVDAGYLYEEVGKYYPNSRFAQFTAHADNNQVFYYQAMGGGTVQEWTEKMYERINRIAQNTPNFRGYVSGGDRHCIIMSDDFYTLETNGVRIRDWMAALANGELPEEVRCTNCETE